MESSSEPKRQGRFMRFINQARFFLSHQICSVEPDGYSPPMRRLLHLARIVMLVLRGFNKNSVQLRASALTFYTLLSLVPILALGFGIAKGFGLDHHLERLIREQLASYPDVANRLVVFSGALLQRTGGGLIAGIGVIMLLWSVIKVFNNMENSFNAIWQISTPRSWSRRFSDYVSMMLIAPILVLVASSANVYAQSLVRRAAANIEFIGALQPYLLVLLQVAPYVLVSLVFALLYLVMPNTKVKLSSALISGLLAGVGFVLVQWVYIYFQVGVSRYNAIYGSFAAIPLFLVWCRISWLIVLLGAELSFAVQNVRLYEYERETKLLSPRRTKELSLLLLHTILLRFRFGEPALSSDELAKEHGLPLRLTRRLIQWMVDAGLLSPVMTPDEKVLVYQPARIEEYFTVGTLIRDYDNHGTTLHAKGEALVAIERIYEEYIAGHEALSKRVDSLSESDSTIK